MARKPPPAISDLVLKKAIEGYKWAAKDTHGRPGTGNAPNGGAVGWIPISRVNLIVGPNNSGKSRFMRALLSGWAGEIEIKGLDSRGARAQIQSDSRSLINLLQNFGTVPERPNVRQDGYGAYVDAAELGLKAATDRAGGRPEMSLEDASRSLNAVRTYVRQQIPEFANPALWGQRYYIPMLRGVRQLEGAADDIYAGTTITDYGISLRRISSQDARCTSASTPCETAS